MFDIVRTMGCWHVFAGSCHFVGVRVVCLCVEIGVQ